MMHHKGNGRFVTEEWHKFREEARLTASSLEEFSDTEITRFDLETAGIGEGDNLAIGVNEPFEREPKDVTELKPTR